jgi:AmmeMemoRadiSam system protein A
MVLMSLTKKNAKILLQVAKQSISNGLENQQPLQVELSDYAEELRKIRATFVTLEINNHLRGCIGTLTAQRPLVSDVAYHAHAAAFSDPRFPKLQALEFPALDIHISILSPPEPITFESEADLIQQLRPGVDGLILSDGFHQGTFLPSVWESLHEPRDFLQHLKQKAGLPSDYWSNTIKLERYTAEYI